MKTVKGELNKAKKQVGNEYSKVKKEVQTEYGKAKKQAEASMKKIGNTKVDYGQLTKNALKIVVPLVVLKMIHSKYKQSHTKTANFEHSIEALYKEIKAKLKNL